MHVHTAAVLERVWIMLATMKWNHRSSKKEVIFLRRATTSREILIYIHTTYNNSHNVQQHCLRGVLSTQLSVREIYVKVNPHNVQQHCMCGVSNTQLSVREIYVKAVYMHACMMRSPTWGNQLRSWVIFYHYLTVGGLRNLDQPLSHFYTGLKTRIYESLWRTLNAKNRTRRMYVRTW